MDIKISDFLLNILSSQDMQSPKLKILKSRSGKSSLVTYSLKVRFEDEPVDQFTLDAIDE